MASIARSVFMAGPRCARLPPLRARSATFCAIPEPYTRIQLRSGLRGLRHIYMSLRNGRILNEIAVKQMSHESLTFCLLGRVGVFATSTCLLKLSLTYFPEHSKLYTYCEAAQRKELVEWRGPHFLGKLKAKAVSQKVPSPNRSLLYEVYNLVIPDLLLILGVVMTAVAAAIINIRTPFVTGELINVIAKSLNTQNSLSLDALKLPAIRLFRLFVAQGFFTFAHISLVSALGEKVARRLKAKLFRAIISQDICFYDEHQSGEIMGRITTDVADFKHTFKQIVTQGLKSVTQTLGSAIHLIQISRSLTFTLCSTMPILYGLLNIYGAYLRRLSKHARNIDGMANGIAAELISNVRTVRSFAAEERDTEVYDAVCENVANANIKLGLHIGLFQGITNASIGCMVLLVLYFGGLQVVKGEISGGDLMTYMISTQAAQKSLGKRADTDVSLGVLFGQTIKAAGSAARVFEYVQLQPQVPLVGGYIPTSCEGNISFRNVSFNYPTRRDHKVLTNFNVDIPKGHMVAFCGPSGSGKSTVAALVERFYEPTDGAIYLDGRDIATLDPSWLRRHIGFINQEPTLFATSILENIRYGNPDATIEEVEEAARLANADQFVKGFPNGYETTVGERGVTLSGGQKQRIAIARAILKNPQILILDEATSALDNESERLVQQALDRVMKGRTVLVIAHRLTTIQDADRIIVMNPGVGNIFEEETVYAIHDFEAENEDEIAFSKNEPLIVLEKDEIYGDGWWQGQNLRGEIGLFPMNYTTTREPPGLTASEPDMPPMPTLASKDKSQSGSNERAALTIETKRKSMDRRISPKLDSRGQTATPVYDMFVNRMESNLSAQSPSSVPSPSAFDMREASSPPTSSAPSIPSQPAPLPGFPPPPIPTAKSLAIASKANGTNAPSMLSKTTPPPNIPIPIPEPLKKNAASPSPSNAPLKSFPSSYASTEGSITTLRDNDLDRRVGNDTPATEINDSKDHFSEPHTSPSESQVAEWSNDDVLLWLERNGLGNVAPNFKEHEITGDVLLELDIEILKELDIHSFGKRYKVMTAIKGLKNSEPGQAIIKADQSDRARNDTEAYPPPSNNDIITSNKTFYPNQTQQRAVQLTNVPKSDVTQDRSSNRGSFETSRKAPTSPSFAETSNTAQGMVLPYRQPRMSPETDTISSTSLSLGGKSSGIHSGSVTPIPGSIPENEAKPKAALQDSHTQRNALSNAKASKTPAAKSLPQSLQKPPGRSPISSVSPRSPPTIGESTKHNRPRANSTLSDNTNLQSGSTSLRAGIKSPQTNLEDLAGRKSSSTTSLVHTSYIPSMDNRAFSQPRDTQASAYIPELRRASVDQPKQDTSPLPDHSGYLHKQGDRYKKWNRRWFVLKGSDLYYFKSPKDTRMKGHIYLQGYKIVMDEKIAPGKWCFKVAHGTERCFYFYADSENEMRSWVKALMKATIARDLSAPVFSSNNLPTIDLKRAQAAKPRPPSVIPPLSSFQSSQLASLGGLGSPSSLNELPSVRLKSSKVSPAGFSYLSSVYEDTESQDQGSVYLRESHRYSGSIDEYTDVHYADDMEDEDERLGMGVFNTPQPSRHRVGQSMSSNGTGANQLYDMDEREVIDPQASAIAPWQTSPQPAWTSKQYIAWVNKYLPKDNHHKVTNLAQGFRSGEVLIQLLENLSGKMVKRPPQQPNGSINMIMLDSIVAAFKFMGREGVTIDGRFNIKDIFGGNEAKIMEMLDVIRRWAVERGYVSKDDVLTPATPIVKHSGLANRATMTSRMMTPTPQPHSVGSHA